MVSVAFAREPISADLLTEALPLLTEHWREIATHADIPLDVDTSAYLAAGEAGVVRLFTVRGERGGVWRDLMGYALFFVRAHLHYTSSSQAVQDVVYLHPSIRGGTGMDFLAYCDEQLRAEGVQVVHHHAKLAHPQLGKALERLGYQAVETVYSRRLDQPTDVEREYVQSLAVGLQAAMDNGSTLAYGNNTRAPWLPKVTESNNLTDFATLMRDFQEMGCEDGG